MTAKLCISASLVRYAPCWKRLSNTQHLRTFQASCSRVFKVAAFQFIFQICFKPCQVCIQPADMLIHLHRRGNRKLNYLKKQLLNQEQEGLITWPLSAWTGMQHLKARRERCTKLERGKWYMQRELKQTEKGKSWSKLAKSKRTQSQCKQREIKEKGMGEGGIKESQSN